MVALLNKGTMAPDRTSVPGESFLTSALTVLTLKLINSVTPQVSLLELWPLCPERVRLCMPPHLQEECLGLCLTQMQLLQFLQPNVIGTPLLSISALD